MLESASFKTVSIEELKSSVGSIFYLWTLVERALCAGIETLNGEVSKKEQHTISRKIVRWESLQAAARAQRPEHDALVSEAIKRLNQALEIRNRIAHGLDSFTPDPFGRSGNPHLGTTLNGVKRALPYDDLEQVMRKLYFLTLTIRMLSEAANETDPIRAGKTYLAIRTNCLP